MVARSARAALALCAALLACVGPAKTTSPPASDDALPSRDDAREPPLQVPRAEDGFLAPNAEDSDGTPAYIHYSREDMPIRVNVKLPKLAARHASREQTDAGVIDAILGWERAIQPALPWFRLEIVRDDRDADIQVEWRTRITGDAAGWGGIRWQAVDGRLRVRGELRYATQPCLAIECRLDLAELKLLVAHEFGHTLGLGHCLDCDSAMNYSWETIERVVVTDTDVRTIRALYEIPSGTRVDGTRLLALRGEAPAR